MSDDRNIAREEEKQQSAMNKLGVEIGKLVSRSMSGQATVEERERIHYLSRERSRLLGQPPKRPSREAFIDRSAYKK